jgi:hypothetical protein
MKHAFLAVIALIVISWIGSLVGLDYCHIYRRFHLPGFQLGPITGSLPYSDNQRSGKIT